LELAARYASTRKKWFSPLSCPECRDILVSPPGPEGEVVCKRCGLVISSSPSSEEIEDWTPGWISNWDEKDTDTVREWLTVLRTVSCQLDLPDLPYREEAARIIRQKGDVLLRSQKLGKRKRETTAALVHLVLNEYEKMRPLKEICQTLSLDYQLVMKYSWIMRRMIKPSRMFLTEDYLRKYGSNLTSDSNTIREAERLLASLKNRISGNPISLAASALYFICRNRKNGISKDEISRAFHISSRTVHNNELRIRRLILGRSPTLVTYQSS